jgi:hypothetical protein
MPPALNAYPDANAPQNPPPPILPPSVEGNENPESDDHEDHRNKIEKTKLKPDHWTKYLESICGAILVMITFYYTRAAYRQVDSMNKTLTQMQIQTAEIQKQTPLIKESADAARNSADLTRQIAESNQAANVEVSAPSEITLGEKNFILTIRLENSGVTTARDVNGDFSISSVRLPSGKTVPSQRVHLEKSQMPTHASVEKTLAFSGFTMGFLQQGTTSIRVDGSFTYGNGFGHINKGSFCQQYMRIAIINSSNGNLWGNDFVPCDKVAETESRNADYADEINKNKNK